MFGNRYGLNALLKEGGRSFSGVDEAVRKNIEAVTTLSGITKTSLGPNCMNKLIINHLKKAFVTSDAAIMMSELEVAHPAANMVVSASKMQDSEQGDGTNFVVIFAGELMAKAEELLKQGLHVNDVVKGYEIALSNIPKLLEDCVCHRITDIQNVDRMAEVLKAPLASKRFGVDIKLDSLVSKAAIQIMPRNCNSFASDNVRTAKLPGGSLAESHVVTGIVVIREPNGPITEKKDCKVMVIGSGLEMTGTETKGTVLLHNADELLKYTKGEEDRMCELMQEIQSAGVEAIICGGAVSDIAQHFANKFGILVLKITSKFELRRVCQTLGATAVMRLGKPLADELGKAEYIKLMEIGSKKVTIINAKDSKVATIVLRGATQNVLDEVERGIEDALNCVKSLIKDPTFVAGAGATEIEIARQIKEMGEKLPGLEQYSVVKFGEALECIPRILATNAGQDATDSVTRIYAAHQKGNKFIGVNVETPKGTIDAKEAKIFDHKETKRLAIELASEAAITVLKVDQIIMARPAGGPKPHERGPADDDD